MAVVRSTPRRWRVKGLFSEMIMRPIDSAQQVLESGEKRNWLLNVSMALVLLGSGCHISPESLRSLSPQMRHFRTQEGSLT